MKKFLLTLAVAAFSLFCTSCDPQVGILYNVSIDGSVAGDVVVTFPNGSLDLNGNTNLMFKYSNDTTVVNNGILLSEALQSNDAKVAAFASEVDNEFNVSLKSTELEGTYDVWIHGYAKEPTTGIVIAIDKEFKYPVNE
jgi:hypothetical protein